MRILDRFCNKGNTYHKIGIKRLLSCLLVAGLMLTCAPAGVWAADIGITQTSGTYPLTNGNSYVINGPFNASNLTIALNSGSATLTVNGNVTINDSATANAKSPLSVAAGATLTLVVNGTLTLYGSAGGTGTEKTSATATSIGGAGGRAAIYVPDRATLVVTGNGTLNAYGGRAGNGGSTVATYDQGASGGGGAGAGIGGNGGTGGLLLNSSGCTTSAGLVYPGMYGSNGGASGSVQLKGTVTVNALGGGGGSGGATKATNVNGGSGAGGGYPAAGIGGGGAGGGSGSSGGGGGGYSGGDAESAATTQSGGVNGEQNKNARSSGEWRLATGGSYFSQGATTINVTHIDKLPIQGALGGGGGACWNTGGNSTTFRGGWGGAGGAGGSVSVAPAVTLHAYNGNQYSDGTAAHTITLSNAINLQTPIYAQLGYALNDIRTKGITAVTGRTASALGSWLYSASVARNIAPTTYGAGIGAGAGFTEGANGSFADESNGVATPPQVGSFANGTLSVYGWSAPTGYHSNASLLGYRVTLYSDAGCTNAVQTLTTGSATPHTAENPFVISNLTEGQTYYVKVAALYGYTEQTAVAGTASAASQGTVIGVTAAPEAGTYYKNVTVKLTSVGVAGNGYTLVYSADGINWSNYPSNGVALTKETTFHYGVRAGGVVHQLGEQTYAISKQPITIGSITIHKYTGGTAREDITGQSTAGLDGQQVCAVVTNPVSYIGGGGCIVIAAYDAANRMKTVSITPLTSGTQTANITSKPITLPGDMASHDIRAFVVTGFADMAPIGRVAKAG